VAAIRLALEEAGIESSRRMGGGAGVRLQEATHDEQACRERFMLLRCGDAEGDAGKKLLTPGERRVAVTWAIEQKGYSQRRACGLVGLEPKTYRYASKRPADGAIRTRLHLLAAERRRFGYRRLHILLAREGVLLNHKRLFRLYHEERLGVRKRGGRKRALGTRSPMALPEAANQRWSLDFVSDALSSGRRFRVLAVIDDFTRECLGLVVDTSLSGLRVGRELDRIVELRGCRPAMVSVTTARS
jgi:putative transposase